MYKYIPMQAQGYTYKDYFTYKCCQAFKAELNEENNRIVADGNSPSHNNQDYFTSKCCQAFKAELNEENNRIVADGNSPSHNN
eukprot:c27912_g2_i2 orf=25-273(+)